MPNLQLLHPILTDLQAWLTDQIVWRRYDFIREPQGFADADRAYCADELIRPLKPEDDLRFVYEDEHGAVYIFAERLAWDSDFFGYQVARLNAVLPSTVLPCPPQINFTDALLALLTEVSKRGIRYLFAPVFPEDLALIHALSRTGFNLIETRLLYHMPLANYTHSERYPVRFARENDLLLLQQTAREAVNAYDRFHADPFIQPEQADRMMEEWVTASLHRGFADATLIPDIAQPAAFNTIRYNRERWDGWGYKVAQTVLTAVSPACRGWHKKLISETNYHLRSLGVDHAILPTQITNRAVLHNLEQLGYRYGRSEYIFRILL
ncbi:MAG: hypothetical protein KF716_02040 [Anaerolineae bacterium]|nr:hypothetical protein [Anaerolineae bacterium]